MKLWELVPIKPNSPHMKASWHQGTVIVRASNSDEARELAKREFTIAIEKSVNQDTPISPWGQYDIVECNAYEDAHLKQDGKPGILHPHFEELICN